MAFVNEYISEEDMEKYEIQKIWKIFYPRSNNIYDLIGRYAWTVDKNKGVFFFPVISGREDESNQQTCVLVCNGVVLTVVLAKVGGSLDFPAKKGFIEWSLVEISKSEIFGYSEAEILVLLKEALSVYQLNGISHPMHSFAVTFNF